MTFEIEEVNSFSRKLVDNYEDSTELEEISDLEEYDDRKHSHREFVQLGKRINLPKRFFRDESVVLKPLIPQFVDSITTGEVISILSSIRTAAEQGEIDSFEVSDFSYDSIIVNSFDHVYEPDVIYIPNSRDFRMKLHEWRNEGRIKYKENRLYIAGASDIEVRWMPSKWGIDDMLLFNRDNINVAQKRYSDADHPEYIDSVEGFNGAKSDDRLMIYLGEEFDEDEGEDEFELLIRSVISEPRLTGNMPHGATVIELPNELLPENYNSQE
ncbi:hypothetical protein [Halorhabdus sp. CBA1104]|uniref:hypothetical protein n=1 Tax=Halorhabdus sp. CBA1104 TaxID=1380432 RepID=UPI0012B28603|nr:hypothetical protein [Halorhabdus sp. CBA1104]